MNAKGKRATKENGKDRHDIRLVFVIETNTLQYGHNTGTAPLKQLNIDVEIRKYCVRIM